ncbi:hypothetical protein AcW1_004182 [Taiwanofungus camphoratus]|nr:hypothetical protein AcV7_007904 [Antrodia cinnamomea]KAI0959327.1 hypothetical protein AcW1_004182 [Antrodia cinnamomea]
MAMVSLDWGVLVASHLSSLFPSSQPISLATTQKDIPSLPLKSPSNPSPEHASHASLFYTPTTGTILLRVTHWGRVLELVPLTQEVPPLRFDFPSPIQPCPSAMIWESQELHIIAVTVTGSLYRIVLSLREGLPSWQPQANRQWYREYVIHNMRESLQGLVQVQGTHCVAIGLPNGSLLRLETECLGHDDINDVWKETTFHSRSFFNSITSFLPSLHGGPPGGSEIISMATFPQPTDIGHIWTLSRDRTLRLWTARSGCVAEKTLPAMVSGEPARPVAETISNSTRPPILLPPEPQRLICVFSVSNSDIPYVLVFIPTESSSTSGGFFQLFSAADDTLQPVKSFVSSEASVHCHLQDFFVEGRTLYTLWDKQGQSIVQEIQLALGKSDMTDRIWQTASYPEEAELTPAYLDELLLSPGSLSDKFFEAIMRPGMFSPLTLQTAINHYTDACHSLPPPHPPQLLTTYANVGEQIAAVVGCTLQLTRDPKTGAPQHSKYWNALKRDWEGFIARCREVERSCRWPLAIGPGEPKGSVIVVERERVASLVGEDLPLRLRRMLLASTALDAQFSLLEIIWMLRTKIGPRSMLSLENRLVDIVHQEIAFPYADIIQDQAQRMNFRDEFDEGFESWITGRLQSIKNLLDAIRLVLDVIGGFDQEVKSEEDEVELALPPTTSEWMRALTSSYVTHSVNARYEICLSLITLLFFLSEDLTSWNPSLLSEIFVVFRGVAMLRHVVRQPAGDCLPPSLPADTATSDDDFVTRMSNMHVSSRHPGLKPAYSLIHRLVTQHGGHSSGLPNSAHQFLDATGLLQSVSPAHATRLEVLFCEKLRLLGYCEVAREMLAWLPRTPGVIYVLGRLWVDEGRYDDAASVIESIAGSFGSDNALSFEDREALAAVLPGTELFESEFDFYLHASSLFKAASSTSHETMFSQLSLAVAPPGIDTTSLWHGLIKGLTDLGLYEDAYAALISTPYDRLKRECISQLVYRMCDEDAVERLMTLNFAGYVDEVGEALSFKARNADPRIRPFYSRILYTWYVARSDYRNAALTMYQRARKLATLIGDPVNFINLAELQLEAYVVSMNALALIDQKNASIVMPVTAETGHEPRKRRKLSKHIPEGRYALGKRDAEIVDLADIQYEYALLSARLDLIRRDPTLLSAGELLLPPPSVVMRMAQSNRFNMAMATARSLDVDMTELFGHLTNQCLRLSRSPDTVM